MSRDGNHYRKGGNQPKQVDGEDERFLWFYQMGLQVCSKLVYVLLKRTPLHEQGPLCNVSVLMEVG